MDTFHEGVELSFRSVTGSATREWVPLMFFTSKSDLGDKSGLHSISLTDSVTNGNSFMLRGYRVPYVVGNGGHYNVSFCSGAQHPLEFRWLQTSSEVNGGFSDVVMLDNISITVHNRTHDATLFENDFDHQNSTE